MKVKNIYISTSIFIFLTFLQPAVSFLLLPLYLKYFPPAEYGIYVLMTNTSFLVAIFSSFRISAAMYPLYYDYHQDKKKLHEFLGNVLGFSIISGLVFLGIFALAGPYVFDFIFTSESIYFYPYGIVAIGTALLNNINKPYINFVKNEKELGKYSIVYLSMIFSSIILQILFIVVYQWGIEGALYAKLLGSVPGTIIVLLYSRNFITFRFNKEFITKALQYSIPLIPFLIISWLQSFGDRFFMEKYLSLETLGIYGLLMSIVALLTMANDAVISGVQPYLYEHYIKGFEKNKQEIKNIYKFYMLFMIISMSGILLIGYNINLFTDNEKYLEITDYLYLAVISFFTLSYSQLFRMNLIYKKKSKTISLYSVITVSFLIGSYVILIPIYGIWGALASNLVYAITLSLLLYNINRKVMPVYFSTKELILLPLLYIAIIVILNTLPLYFDEISYMPISILQFVMITGIIILSNYSLFKSKVYHIFLKK